MTGVVPVVDLFSGPGGLAEGFAALRDSGGRPCFRVDLSIEMDATAHRTLRLRAFLRKFPSCFPPEYYDFLNGTAADEPDWAALYPSEWQLACAETQCLELGTSDAAPVVRQRVRMIRKERGTRTVLLGGPPCQSYSVVGRARNAGNVEYDANKDERQSLYRQYANVLRQLQPAVAVMENVKGMLSARHKGRPVFPEVMASLRHAGGEERYRLFALSSLHVGRSWEEGLQPKDFLVRAEAHGIPQRRHRVFVICIRSDVAEKLPEDILPRLETSETAVSVHDVIGAMPTLRSRLSRNDHAASWQEVVRGASASIRGLQPPMTQDQQARFSQALDLARESAQGAAPPFGAAAGGIAIAESCPAGLSEWLVDGNLTKLPNNETKGHMHKDIERYLYAAAFACACERSPKASDFPSALAPNHANWNTGKFHDRFRVQLRDRPCTTVTSHISKDGHYFIHPDPRQCRSLTVREAARLQTFPDNYFFHGGRSHQYVQVGNAVPPYLAWQIAGRVWNVVDHHYRIRETELGRTSSVPSPLPETEAFPVPVEATGVS